MKVFILLLTAFALATSDNSSPGRDKRDDDVSLASLKTIVEQQASLIQSLQAQLTATGNDLAATKADLTATKTGLHTLESKVDLSATAVAFTVRFAFSHDTSPDHGIPLGGHQTLIFDEPATNIGQGHNPTTGIFTVPVEGTYTFFLRQTAPNTHGDLQLAVVKNGVVVDDVWTEGTSDKHDQSSSLVTIHCAKGDQVWVKRDEGDREKVGWLAQFFGFLLQVLGFLLHVLVVVAIVVVVVVVFFPFIVYASIARLFVK